MSDTKPGGEVLPFQEPYEGNPISFMYDREKAQQVVLWFCHKHGHAINYLKLFTLIFMADREHLVNYGRPIIGGHYYALSHGPVLLELWYDIWTQKPKKDVTLKEMEYFLRYYGRPVPKREDNWFEALMKTVKRR